MYGFGDDAVPYKETVDLVEVRPFACVWPASNHSLTHSSVSLSTAAPGHCCRLRERAGAQGAGRRGGQGRPHAA